MNRHYIDNQPICLACWQRCFDWFCIQNMGALHRFNLYAIPTWANLKETNKPCIHVHVIRPYWEFVPNRKVWEAPQNFNAGMRNGA